MAADDCASQLFVCALQVTALEDDGTPMTGDANTYVSNSLQTATVTPAYDAGDEVKEKNACGETLIDFLDDPTFIRADLSLDFITPDPTLHSILISQGVLLTGPGGGLGFAFPPIGKVTSNGVSIEMWAKRIIRGAQSTVHPWALWGLPFVKSLQLGARSFTNAAQHSLITGQCLENDNFGDGPGGDWTGVATDRVAQWVPVDSIPDAVCAGVAGS